MKIGFPPDPRKDILEEIKWIGENGFDFVDLFLEEGRNTPDKIDLLKVKKLLSQYNLSTVGHLCWNFPLGSSVKTFRDASVIEAERYFKVFSKLNVKYVTVHSNWSAYFSDDQLINFQVETLKRMVKLANKYKLKLMYEPVGNSKDNIKTVEMVLSKVKGLFFHLDIGHANLVEGAEEYIKKFRKKLVHVHMHDNFGEEDLHLPLGAGSVDWRSVIKTLRKYYDGTITLEVFSSDRDYVLLSKQKLEKLWKEV